MNCPVCTSTALVMSERSGVEIDYCPQCRGVWLDRGELDKILDRAGGERSPAPERSSPPPGYDDGRRYATKKKKSSWLTEIFD